jgi:uncharacterized protein YlxW (UPF0749 family)
MLIAISIFCLAAANLFQSYLYHRNNKNNDKFTKENIETNKKIADYQEKNFILNEKVIEFNRQITFSGEERAKEIHEATLSQVKKNRVQIVNLE